MCKKPSWTWSYGSWIYDYEICNQCLSPLMLWVRIPLRLGVLDTTLCDKGSTLVSSTNKTDRHDTCITEILLKVALNTITLDSLDVKTDCIRKVDNINIYHLSLQSWRSRCQKNSMLWHRCWSGRSFYFLTW